MKVKNMINLRKQIGLLFLILASAGIIPVQSAESAEGEARAVLVEGTGTYTRPISTKSNIAQQFFDQGLRLTWGYYFPEAIASHQEALRYTP